MVTPKDFVHRFYRMTNDLIVTQSTVESNSYCILNQSTYVKSLRKSGPHGKIVTNQMN